MFKMEVQKKSLPSPEQIKKQYPLLPKQRLFLERSRGQAEKIVRRKTSQLAAIVGPCSIHDSASALEYALRLKKLSDNLNGSLFLAMRFFIEKPRTRLGWKGLLYDPRLDGSNDLSEGIRLSRELLLKMAELEVPCACEILEPLAIDYIGDLLSWGLIGARTSASQPHRQLASGLPFPVGFKNGIHGDIDVAIAAVHSARVPHSHIGLTEKGRIAAVQTSGNPLAHIVLRGSETRVNYDSASLSEIAWTMKQHRLDPCFLVDCGHGNSGRDPIRQKAAFQSVITQAAEGNSSILGLMLESHLQGGKQPLLEDPYDLLYGVSITDPCLGWEETEELLRWADDLLSMSISSVQK